MTREELLQVAKPILFNTDMVKAILFGRKTQTRRVIKGKIKISKESGELEYHPYKGMMIRGRRYESIIYPGGVKQFVERESKYKPGDILYVRETWDNLPVNPDGTYCGYNRYYYRADGDTRPEGWKGNWKPSIHMKKSAARIFLKVTDVRVERLQDITEEQVYEEGFRFKPPCKSMVSADGHYCDFDGPCTSSIKYCDMSMGELFGKFLWDSTCKKNLQVHGWDANPWVWVIEFESVVEE